MISSNTAVDYIVIGSGSSGSPIASRLSEQTDLSVLLLEAGGADLSPEIHVPHKFISLCTNPQFSWLYYSEPLTRCHDRKDFTPRGKVLGGCTSINAMVFQRGHPSNYDHWADLGNKGWAWKDVLPYFKKLQHQERGASECHGVGGPMNISEPRDPHILSKTFVKATQELGYPANDDFNSGNQEGFGIFQVSQKDGMRHSTVRGYLDPARARLNLNIITQAHVTRLVFNNANECTGVIYVKDGKEVEVASRREVILSAGAMNSPQILLLSGIGPKQDLEKLGIKVLVDLPGVGKNLQEHIYVAVANYCKEPISLLSVSSEEALKKYEKNKTGPLTSNLMEAGGFITLNPASPAPEIQFGFCPGFFMSGSIKPPTEGDGMTIGAVVVDTKSKGHIELFSANPFDPPKIDYNFLAEESDLEQLVAALKIARKIFKSSEFDRYRGEEFAPGSAIQDDHQIKEWIKDAVQNVFHPVGTCKMGDKNDNMAVVNDQLEVYGVKRLRVADASIMPTIINANTNTPCIMIGEKCADIILHSLNNK